ncbi:hypothetical protein CN071_27840 [Sinorhizobium meliloti]|uniref:dihydrofolate reductase n=1 Tax=Rhizobium meliloti TaxID=382 RepID=UPI000FE11127|nr:dihydrofolate reductase [Sinorhizobium meliloti]RVP57116.1 hypothetical protein CN071_27840 [Sinorhizobium meliloti]
MDEVPAKVFEAMAAGLISTGMSYRAVARESRLSVATIYRAAQGECREPSARAFQLLRKTWDSHGQPLPNRSRR